MPRPSHASTTSAPVEQLLTREMRADLFKLEDARPIGFVRVSDGWRYGTAFISRARASWLIDGKLARRVYGKNVRLQISQAGRRAIGAYQ